MAIKRVTITIMVCVAVSLISMASAIPGTATFYDTQDLALCNNVGDRMIVAVSDGMFNNGAACERMLRFTCVGSPCRGNGGVTVRIADRCPACQNNQFDLSREAFSQIADPALVGRINIDYTQV